MKGFDERETLEKGKSSNGEEGEGNEEKTETKKLWQLRAAWKKAECETARIEVGFSIEILDSDLDLDRKNILSYEQLGIMIKGGKTDETGHSNVVRVKILDF